MLAKQTTIATHTDAFLSAAGVCPQARSGEHIVAQEVLDEFVIYDTQSHKVHNLNATAASVWQWCDGQTPPTALAQRLAAHYNLPLEQAEPLLWLTLKRLEKAQLLQTTVVLPSTTQTVDRRRLLRMLGAAAALPVIYSIVAPAAVHALSLIPGCPGGNGNSGTCYETCNCTPPLLSNGSPTRACSACDNSNQGGGTPRSWLFGGVCYVLGNCP